MTMKITSSSVTPENQRIVVMANECNISKIYQYSDNLMAA